MLWAGIRLSQSDALSWYTAIPERCSGLVYGVPLGHGAEVNGGRARWLVDPGRLWWWRTQSGALGWYTVSRWDTGRR
jgi:hypothetical protein